MPWAFNMRRSIAVNQERAYRFIGRMNHLPLTGRMAGTAPPNSNGVPPIRGIFEQCS